VLASNAVVDLERQFVVLLGEPAGETGKRI
jgi:hypothetical protein